MSEPDARTPRPPSALAGRRLVVTRPGERGDALVRQLEAHGASVVHAPMTRIVMHDREGLAYRLAARTHQWVLFTSANGVRAAADAARLVDPVGGLAATLTGIGVAAVGRVTAEALHDAGCAPVVVPGRYDAEALLEALERREDVRGARVLYPAAAGAREVLAEGLAALGARVDTVIAYESAPDPAGASTLRAAIARASIDMVVLMAPSAVDAYVAAAGPEVAGRTPAASIGPVTTDALDAHGIVPVVEAGEATADALVAAIVGHYEPPPAARYIGGHAS